MLVLERCRLRWNLWHHSGSVLVGIPDGQELWHHSISGAVRMPAGQELWHHSLRRALAAATHCDPLRGGRPRGELRPHLRAELVLAAVHDVPDRAAHALLLRVCAQQVLLHLRQHDPLGRDGGKSP